MRKILFPASAIALCIPFIANAMGIQVILNGQSVVLSDVPQSTWFSTYVHDAAEAGIVNGYKDASGNFTGRFGPSDNVTIAQALKISIEGAGYDTTKYSNVIDSGTGNHWASPYVSVAQGEHFHIVNGTIDLDRAATRGEVASMFADAFKVHLDMQPLSSFKDVDPTIPDAPAIAALSLAKIISGDTDSDGTATGFFRPSDHINRAEVVKIVMLARAQYAEPGTQSSPQTSSAATQSDLTVHYTANGFSPSVLHIHAGDTVIFTNDTTGAMWVQGSSNYAGFDARRGMGQGSIYTFTFNKIGTWGYQNYVHPSDVGTIVVDQ